MNFQHELESALEAAQLAGEAVLEIYGGFEAVADAPADITTEADRQSQEIIVAHLHRAFPGDAFCAEETTAQLSKLAHFGPRLWVVDPIDGTRGFARKNGEFSVMIAFADRGQLAVGVVLEPARQRLTYAVRGAGCHRRDGLKGQLVRCQVTQTSELRKAIVTQSRSHRDGPPSPQLRAIAPAGTMETYSAGIKLAQVARGEADIYLNTYPAFHDWDVCAGHILVTEAGGTVTGLRGEPIHYGQKEASQRTGLVASNSKLHAALVGALQKV